MPAWAMWGINGFFCLLCIAAIFWPLPKDVRRYETVTRKPSEKM
jgi:hypothetical protein